MKPILACKPWANNSALIADVARLGYLRKEWRTLDPTFGAGNWWKEWRPDDLVEHDLKIDGEDFRNLHYPDKTFQAVAYDPPFISPGGRSTSKIKAMYEAYGLMGAPTSPETLQTLINAGIEEAHRVLVSKGTLLVKSMNYVSSGKLWPGTYETYGFAKEMGFRLKAEFVMASKAGGPQPKNRTRQEGGKTVKSNQKHPRNNYSTLHIFEKSK